MSDDADSDAHVVEVINPLGRPAAVCACGASSWAEGATDAAEWTREHVLASAETAEGGTGDHPHADPGDGRTECPTCRKFVWLVTHSCKGIPVTDRAKVRDGAEKDALAAALQGIDFSTFRVGNPWMYRAAQLLGSDWMAKHDEALRAEHRQQMAKATVLAYDQGRKDEREGSSDV